MRGSCFACGPAGAKGSHGSLGLLTPSCPLALCTSAAQGPQMPQMALCGRTCLSVCAYVHTVSVFPGLSPPSQSPVLHGPAGTGEPSPSDMRLYLRSPRSGPLQHCWDAHTRTSALVQVSAHSTHMRSSPRAAVEAHTRGSGRGGHQFHQHHAPQIGALLISPVLTETSEGV